MYFSKLITDVSSCFSLEADVQTDTLARFPASIPAIVEGTEGLSRE